MSFSQGVGHFGPLKRLLLILILAAAMLALQGCTPGRGGPVPYEPANFGKPDVETLAVTQGPQRIGPLDKVKVMVFQVDSLSGEFQVDSAGHLELPLIGTVVARDLTAPELAQSIAVKLGERYLRSPNVQVSLTETPAQTITVDGSVNQPGVFPVKGTTTLMRAVAMARGAAQDANPSRVIIFRTVNGERMAGAFDLKSIRRAESPDPLVYGNDIVIVDGTRAQQLFQTILSSIPLLSVLRPY